MRAFGPVWYCARTKPKHEHIAAANVGKQLGLEVFHPRLRVERLTCRGPVRVIESVFPCYIFVRCNPGEHLDDLRYIHGVSSLVQFGFRIPVVPDAVIAELRQCFELTDTVCAEELLTPGREVTVARGALLGARAVVVRVLPAKRRVQVLLDLLGQTTLTEVNRDWLAVEDRSLAGLVPQLASVPQGSLAGCVPVGA